MEKKDRVICFTFNAIAIFLIVVIVYFNFKVLMYLPKPPYEGPPSYSRYFVIIISAFFCSLLLQGEEILMISQQRKSLLLRWEMITLGVVTLLIVFIKFWYLLLFPINNMISGTEFNFFTASVAVLFGVTIDIVYMFVAGVFFVHAFHIQDGLIEKKNRKNSFIIYALLLLLIVVIDYCNVWFFQSEFNKTREFLYILYFSNIFKIFAYSLVLQGEKILTIIRNKKALIIRWELIILGFIAVLFAIIKNWLPLIFPQYDAGFGLFNVMIQSIIVSEIWQIAYMFAAGMLFVRAFHVKTDQID